MTCRQDPDLGPDHVHSTLKANLVKDLLLLQVPQRLREAGGVTLRQQVMALQRAGRPLQHPHSLAHKQYALSYADRDIGWQGLH